MQENYSIPHHQNQSKSSPGIPPHKSYAKNYQAFLDLIATHCGIRKGAGPSCVHLMPPKYLPIRLTDSRDIFNIYLAYPYKSGQNPIPGYHLEGRPQCFTMEIPNEK